MDMLMAEHWFVIPAAFVLDLILGDPLWLFHPIRWMGNGILYFEPLFRRLIKKPLVSGGLFSIFLISITFLIALACVKCAYLLSEPLGILLEIVLVYYCISAKSLMQAAMAVDRALKEKGLPAGREKLSWIVGREVKDLTEQGVIRGAVETVGENLVDGVISPLFFAAIGGAPLAMAYKMVNTLDSMVGYKNDKYLYFGRIAARIDDVANYIPARLSVPVIALASKILSGNGKVSLFTGITEGRNHSSPNAGFSEAAFAGAMGVRLGGPNYYHGKRVEKPYIGTRFGDVGKGDIDKACRLMLLSSLVWMLILWGGLWAAA